ncbi:hypothetical protein QUF80_08485 [Desulfococcaceae bacterium HSG8]|nr:hypothetical protein [Desulfococcaceae bacterium HSG8]
MRLGLDPGANAPERARFLGLKSQATIRRPSGAVNLLDRFWIGRLCKALPSGQNAPEGQGIVAWDFNPKILGLKHIAFGAFWPGNLGIKIPSYDTSPLRG